MREWEFVFFVFERDGPAPVEPRPDRSHNMCMYCYVILRKYMPTYLRNITPNIQ
jgi:hypothetical protein